VISEGQISKQGNSSSVWLSEDRGAGNTILNGGRSSGDVEGSNATRDGERRGLERTEQREGNGGPGVVSTQARGTKNRFTGVRLRQRIEESCWDLIRNKVKRIIPAKERRPNALL